MRNCSAKNFFEMAARSARLFAADDAVEVDMFLVLGNPTRPCERGGKEEGGGETGAGELVQAEETSAGLS